MNALWIAIVLAALAQVSPGATGAPGPVPGDIVLERAKITSQNDVEISAEVEGTLIKLPAREGMLMTKGDVLATIDDRQALAAVDVAQISYNAALKKAQDDIELRFAKKAAAYAYEDWQADLAANQNERGLTAVTEITLRQKKLGYDKAVLQIEKAANDQVLAEMDAKVKEAELKAAQVALERRTIKAPFDGIVQRRFFDEAEWVNPGDPILQLVQFDVLHVERYVSSTDYDPVDIANRRVTVTVRLARNQEISVPGRVVFVNQAVLGGESKAVGGYLVRAEIQNQRKGDYWVIRPGLDATMTIHMGDEPAAAAPQAAALPRP
jgi:multidrug efflux pump subunit AcrA (membrane-fusion protein)